MYLQYPDTRAENLDDFEKYVDFDPTRGRTRS